MPGAGDIPWARDRYLLTALVLCLVQLILLSGRLVVPDLISQYPFMAADSQDWIANGLWLAGFDVRYSVRPPVLPLMIAALERAGSLQVLPVILLLLSQLSVPMIYCRLRGSCGRPIALTMALALLASYSWLGLGLEIMADVPAASLLFAGSWCFMRAVSGRSRWFLAGGVLIGLSAVTQQLALLFPLPAGCALLVHRRDQLREPALWAGAALGLIPFAAWSVHKAASFGTAGDVVMRHWSLVGFHVDSVGSYVLSGLSLLGLPLALFAVVGFAILAVRSRQHFDDAFVAGMLLVIIGFVVFFYQYHSKRLLVYAMPFALIAAAEAVRRLPSRPIRGAAAVVVLLGSLMPLPVIASDDRWSAIWPIPPTYLHALDVRQGAVPKAAFGGLERVTFSPNEVLGWSVRARLADAVDHLSRVAPFDFEAVDDADSAVWIHDGEVSPRDRYQVGLRLGNVLRKRVKHAPLEPLAQHLGVVEAGTPAVFESWHIRPVLLDGVAGEWLLVSGRGGSTDRLLASGDGFVEESYSSVEQARRIAELAGRLPVVVVLETGIAPSSLVYLPFLVSSPEFFILDGDRFRSAAASFGANPPRRIEHLESSTVSVLEATGRHWTVVEYR